MVRRQSIKRTGQSSRKSSTTGSLSGTSADLFAQMEGLQKDLLMLSQRAERDVEEGLKGNPSPLIDVLEDFSSRVGATRGACWLEASCVNRLEIHGLPPIQLCDSDKLQCDIALSGREMSFDFVQGRIFFPVVIFENPVAIAVFEIPALNSSNYEKVCLVARDGILNLREKFRVKQKDARERCHVAS